MKIAVIITSNEFEKSWNALRYMNTALNMGHDVTGFLMNGGVEVEFMDHETFNIQEQLNKFIDEGGKLLSCGTCLQFRKIHDKVKKSEVANLMDCVKLTEDSDKVLTF